LISIVGDGVGLVSPVSNKSSWISGLVVVISIVVIVGINKEVGIISESIHSDNFSTWWVCDVSVLGEGVSN
jgi:hypothetical protein